MGFLITMQNRIQELENQMEKLENEIIQLKNAKFQIAEAVHKIEKMVTDLHSKPQSVIDRLILPEQVKDSVVETSNEKVLQEEGLVEGYFYIRNDFPMPTVFYISKGVEREMKDYGGYVYLGGNRALNQSGKPFDLMELQKKYFPTNR